MYKKSKSVKSKKFRYRFDMVILFCVLVFISCFVIYMFKGEIITGTSNSNLDNGTVINNSSTSLDDSSADSEDLSVVDSTSSEEVSSVNDSKIVVNPVPQSETLDMSYFDNCVFIGDSLTVGLSAYNILSVDNVVASTGLNISKIDTEKIDTTAGSLTAYEAVSSKKPANIYIMLGSNGISWLSNDSMISKYKAFVDEIKEALPTTKIYIVSIPPVTAGRELVAEGSIKNSKIDTYNSELLKMANEKGIYFVDINTALKNNSGKLDADRAEKDGMHFKKATYDIMLGYLLSHIAQ